MNASDASTQQISPPPPRHPKPPPAGPAPPAPATAPPAPPNHTNSAPVSHLSPPSYHVHSCSPDINGNHTPSHNAKGKKRNEVPIDPATMYESLKNRIAALEEEEVLEEEEERRYGAYNFQRSLVVQRQRPFFYSAEEAQKSVKGLEENAIHSKYIELVNLCFKSTFLNRLFRLTTPQVCRTETHGTGPC